jgi:hypothetical protein
MQSKKLLVMYLSIAGMNQDQVPEYVAVVSEKVLTDEIKENYISIVVPVLSETRIECIDPTYITDQELIKKNERLMAELHEKFLEQLEMYKNILGENE